MSVSVSQVPYSYFRASGDDHFLRTTATWEAADVIRPFHVWYPVNACHHQRVTVVVTVVMEYFESAFFSFGLDFQTRRISGVLL